MALLVKNIRQASTGPTNPGFATLEQWTHVQRGALLLPATTTEQIFRVVGGKVLVHALIGTVTVLLDGTNPVLKVSSAQLNAAGDTVVGTAVDIASTVDISNLELGGTVFVEGDGTAIVKANAGCTLMGTNTGKWVAPQGQIYITTGGTNLTGFIQWDIWYQPLDAGAYVYAVSVATAKV